MFLSYNSLGMTGLLYVMSPVPPLTDTVTAALPDNSRRLACATRMQEERSSVEECHQTRNSHSADYSVKFVTSPVEPGATDNTISP